MYDKYRSVAKVAEALEISTAMVTMSLPYEKTVYGLEENGCGEMNANVIWHTVKR
jgi:hypothetical protein